jgi:hypothetical protein
MNDLDPTVELALLSLPDKQVFSKPMSKKARTLLNGILKWAYQHSGKCFKSASPAVDCYRAFVKEYAAIKFEDACHRFDMSTYMSALNKNFRPNKADNLLKLMLLANLEDNSWVSDNGIKSNVNRVGSLKIEKTVVLYEWLTTQFLVTDFTEIDLNKLSAMGDEKYPIQVIKEAASNIKDIDKHNISYLYAIVRDSAARAEVTRNREHISDSKNDELLRQLFSTTGPKQQYEIPDKTSDWNREREWIDVMRDLKEKLND